jgi:hypothetical protein
MSEGGKPSSDPPPQEDPGDPDEASMGLKAVEAELAKALQQSGSKLARCLEAMEQVRFWLIVCSRLWIPVCQTSAYSVCLPAGKVQGWPGLLQSLELRRLTYGR